MRARRGQLPYQRCGRLPDQQLKGGHGWDSITPTEQHFIDLLQSGLSNAEIGLRLLMSSRTVQTHFTHVFAKLALATRAELADAAAVRCDQHT